MIKQKNIVKYIRVVGSDPKKKVYIVCSDLLML